jgi:hypothetical protein
MSVRDREWKATPLSGVGFLDPATIAFFAQAAKGTREGGGITDIFGPTAGFQERQAIRDEYNALADGLRDSLPGMPPGIVKEAIAMYLPVTRSVIVRGAKAADLSELKAKADEWRALAMTVVPTTGPDIAPALDLAGFPWYVWAIGLGLLLPVILKRK